MSRRTIRMSIFLPLLLLPLLMGLFLLFSPVVVRTASVHADGSQIEPNTCSYNACDGQNPITAGCVVDIIASDQYNTVPFSDFGGGTIQMRYSNLCHAAWGRIDFNSPIQLNSSGYANAKITRDTDNKTLTCADTGGNGVVLPGQTFCFTPMLGDGSPIDASGNSVTEHVTVSGLYESGTFLPGGAGATYNETLLNQTQPF